MVSKAASGESNSLGSFRHVLTAFLICRLVLEIIGILSLFYFPPASAIGPARDLRYHAGVSPFLGIWARWDSEWYLMVAEKGYQSYDYFKTFGGGKYMPQETAKVLPAFPMGIRFLTFLSNNSVLSGFILANFCALLFFYYLFRLALKLFDERTALTSALLYIVFPTGFFLSAIYSESLFLAAVTACFFYLEEKKLFPAMIAAVITVLARPQGVLAIPALLWLAWLRFPERKGTAVTLMGIACFVPLAGYAMFIMDIFGSPKWITETVRYWRGDTRYPLYAIVRFFQNPIAIHGQHNSIIDFTFGVFQLAVLCISFRKLPIPYYIYSIIVVVFPLSSSLFSFSRLCLVNFPFFLYLGRTSFGRSMPTQVSFTMLQAFFFAAFVNWYWVA
jgi:Gpi18-like mannosyltransferase